MRRRSLLVGLAALACVTPRPRAAAAPAADSAKALAELVETTRAYQASLARLLPFRDDAVRRAAEQLATRQRLLHSGAVARLDVETAAATLAAAERDLARTHEDIAAAERLVAEARASLAILTAPPAPRATDDDGGLIRHAGTARWSLARTPQVEQFFAERFGRALPISALGQTRLHDQLGFDHRQAMDVAVHPDSAEGRALMAWLRAQDVPFLAFRSAVTGAATGAHVHIGDPSGRLPVPSRRG